MRTRLLTADARRTLRDPMLMLLAVIPPLLVAGYAASLPRIAARVSDADTMAMLHIGALATLLLLTPLMFGFVAGLMLLDERDEGVLTVIALSPLGTTRFIAYRLMLPALWSALVAALVLLVLPASLAVAVRVLLPLLAALQAPLMTLFLGAFAGNKVEGLALAKVGNVVAMLGALAPLLPAPWLWSGAPIPHFWVVRLMLVQPAGAQLGLSVAAALLVHVAALVLLARVQRH